MPANELLTQMNADVAQMNVLQYTTFEDMFSVRP